MNQIEVVYGNKRIVNTTTIEKICFMFVIIDIICIPYFKWFSISLSVPIVLFWMLKNARWLFKSKEGNALLIMGMIMAFCVLISIVYPFPVRKSTDFVTSFKRAVQYFICMGYYLYFYELFTKYKINLKGVLFWLLVIISIGAFVYLLFPHSLAEFKCLIYPADAHSHRYLEGLIDYRYNYLLVDPNNLAYLISGICGWICLNKSESLGFKGVCLVLSVLIVLCTKSGGGVFALFITIVCCFFAELAVSKSRRMVRVGTLMFVLCAVLFVLYSFSRFNVLEIFNTYYMNSFKERMGHYSSGLNIDITGGRLSDFTKSIHYLNPMMLVIGSGTEGITFEIGHLYVIGMFGLLAYLCFMWYTFRKERSEKWREWIWKLPFFIGFTMNIAIGEFKWLAIYYMILAYSRIEIGKEYNFTKLKGGL